MGTAIPTILTKDFKGNDIIVIDDDSRRESYLHDELINTFGGRLVTQETAAETTTQEANIEAAGEGYFARIVLGSDGHTYGS